MYRKYILLFQASNYAFLLLTEIMYEMDSKDTELHDTVALLLHMGSLGLDNSHNLIRENCQRLLCNLVHSNCFDNQKSKFILGTGKVRVVHSYNYYIKSLIFEKLIVLAECLDQSHL